jgi:hypothetical protein
MEEWGPYARAQPLKPDLVSLRSTMSRRTSALASFLSQRLRYLPCSSILNHLAFQRHQHHGVF